MKKIIAFTAIQIVLLTSALCGQDFYSNPAEYSFAEELFRGNNFRLSRSLFESYSASVPESALSGDTKFMSAEAEYNMGLYSKAMKSYREILDKYPRAGLKHRPEVFYRIAGCAYQMRSYQESLAHIEQLLKEHPESYLVKDALMLKAENLFLLERHAEALDVLNKLGAYQDYAYFDYVYYLTGRIFYEKASAPGAKNVKQDAAESLKYFERVGKEFPESKIISRAEFRKANVYYLLGQYDRAVKISDALLASEKERGFVSLVRYFKAWNLYMQEKYTDAAKSYESIADDYKGDIIAVWSLYKKGLCYEAAGRRDDALATFADVVKEHPVTVPAAYSKYAIAQHYYNAGDYYGSLIHFEELMRRYNVDELTRAAKFMTADIYLKTGRYGRAKEAFAGIEKEGGRDAVTAKYMRAWSMHKEGEFAASTALFDEIIKDENTPGEFRIKSILKAGDNAFETGDTASASSRYNEVIRNHGGFADLAAEARYGLGWIEYKRNNYDGAASYFSRARGLAKENSLKSRAYFMEANAKYGGYRFDEALVIYNSIMNDGRVPQELRDDALFYAAWCRYRKGEFDESVRMWQQYAGRVKDSAKKAEAYYRAGWAYFRKNDFDRAIKEFAIILNNYPSTHMYQEALLKTGDSHYNKKEYEKAISYYKQLVEGFPQHYRVPEALYGTQWSYYQLGNNEAAIELSRQFLEKFPGSSYTPEILYRVAEHYYNNGRFETAAAEFLKFIEKNPSHELADNAYYWMGLSNLKLKKYLEAISNFRALNEKFPKNKFADKALFRTANAYYSLHDYKSAIENYGAFTEKYPGNTHEGDAYFNIAMSYKRLDDVKNAETWYVKYDEKFPKGSLIERARMNLGYLLQDEKRYDEAVAAFRKAESLGGKKAVEAQFWIADCLQAKGDSAGAIKEYLRTFEKYPAQEMWSITALDAAGKLYEKQGKLKDAIKIYKKIASSTKTKKYVEAALKKAGLLEEQDRLMNPPAPAPTAAESGVKK